MDKERSELIGDSLFEVPSAPPSYYAAVQQPPSHNTPMPPPVQYIQPITVNTTVQQPPSHNPPMPPPVQYIQPISVHTTAAFQPTVGPKSTLVICPQCRNRVRTRVNHRCTPNNQFWSILCCIITWPLLCVCGECHSLQDVDHYCPNCEAFIGSYVK